MPENDASSSEFEDMLAHAEAEIESTPWSQALADPRVQRFGRFLATHDGHQKYDEPDLLEYIVKRYGFVGEELRDLIDTASILAEGNDDQA